MEKDSASCGLRSHQHFINDEGVFNMRSFGGYPSDVFPNTVTREGVIYRSGHLNDVTSLGWGKLKGMGVSTIIDLTSPGEVEMVTGIPDHAPNRLGIRTIHIPFKKGPFSMEKHVQKYRGYIATGAKAIALGYLGVLRDGSAIIRSILVHFRDNTNGACLIHCTMGKDRTGVIFAFLLSLVGVEDDTIADEYRLSDGHLQHLQPKIAEIVREIDPAENDAQEIARLATECRKEVMDITLQLIDVEYGGAAQYAMEHCALSKEDIDRIRHNLLSS